MENSVLKQACISYLHFNSKLIVLDSNRCYLANDGIWNANSNINFNKNLEAKPIAIRF